MKKNQESSKQSSISFSEILEAQALDCQKGLPIDEGLMYYYKCDNKAALRQMMGDQAPTKAEEKRLARLIEKHEA